MEMTSKKIIAIVLSLAIVIGGVLGFVLTRGDDSVTIVSLDVNPSIQLAVNADGVVEDVVTVNADAAALLDGKELAGLELEAAVGEILDTLVANEYISETANSILVSVENANPELANTVKSAVTNVINTVLTPIIGETNILEQTFDNVPEDIAALAKQFGISEGKASFIADIVAENDHLSFDMLAEMSINDISLLVESSAVVTPEGLEVHGAANANAYISQETALGTLLHNLGIPVDEAMNASVEFNLNKDGVMVMDVYFIYGENEFDASMNASTAEILEIVKKAINVSGIVLENSNDLIKGVIAGDGEIIEQSITNIIDQSLEEFLGEDADNIPEETKDTIKDAASSVLSGESTPEEAIDKAIDDVIENNIPSTGNSALDEAIKDAASDAAKDALNDAASGSSKEEIVNDTVNNVIENLSDEEIADIAGSLTDEEIADIAGNLTDEQIEDIVGNVSGDDISNIVDNMTDEQKSDLISGVLGGLLG